MYLKKKEAKMIYYIT